LTLFSEGHSLAWNTDELQKTFYFKIIVYEAQTLRTMDAQNWRDGGGWEEEPMGRPQREKRYFHWTRDK
jgi:hypothetical protein